MFVAGPNEDAGRAPRMLAPQCYRGPLSDQRLPASARHLKRQQGVAPELRLKRLPMSIRNGTSSSAIPQRQSSVA